MSAYDPKRTFVFASRMSAFEGKADIFDRKPDIELAPITVFIGPHPATISVFALTLRNRSGIPVLPVKQSLRAYFRNT
jgi:hypothetical protein